MFKKKSGIKRDVRSRNIEEEDGTSSNKDDSFSDLKKEGEGSGSSQLTQSGARKTNDDFELGSAVISKKRKVQAMNPLAQSSNSFSRLRSNRYHDAGLDSDDEFDQSDRNDNKAEGKSQSTISSSAREDATRTNTWYDDLSEKTMITKDDTDAVTNDDGVYRGKAAYNKYTSADNAESSNKPKGMAKGPIRANNNVRTITMVDYQPSVCKPYKETGMCGYGDSCIYLHDRSDYLAGWQLDKISSNALGKRGDLLETVKEDQEQDLPFACLICRQQFTDPIVTKCGHYFCMGCALKRYEKTSKCFACRKQTQGIFNSAKKILDRMANIRAALQEERGEENWNEDEDETNSPIPQINGELLKGVEIGNSLEFVSLL